ncbi:MAG: class II aldolase/adducin family protein [Planctomycetota bacterium]|jgi:L-fuculose-phosphate aldolase
MTEAASQELPRHVAATMRRVYRRRLTTVAGGNISIRDDAQRVWITPAGQDKGRLSAGDIVRVDPDGTFRGPGQPSSELPMALHVYRRRPDLHAIIHAHAPALVAFSIRHEVPDTDVLPESAAACGPVGYVPYELTGTDRLGERSADVFADGSNCVILENHGVAVAGADVNEAFHRLETLEITAQVITAARGLGEIHRPPSPLPPSARSPEMVSAGDPARRQELCDFIRRGYERHLVSGLLGGFSARIGDDLIVTSPHGGDVEALDPDDLVRPGPLPSAIYAAHPGIHAVIIATPVNATAFSVTGRPLDTQVTAESHLLLGDVATVPSDVVSGDPQRVATMVSAQRPAALLGNYGVLVVGGTMLEAYERLEALEATAEAALIARSLGGVIPIRDGSLGEVDDAKR